MKTTSAAKANRKADIVDRLEAENEQLRAALLAMNRLNMKVAGMQAYLRMIIATRDLEHAQLLAKRALDSSVDEQRLDFAAPISEKEQ